MGANIKAIKARIRSVNSTMHVTKAMELVASSKIRKATERMEAGRFFYETMAAAFAELAREGVDSVYGSLRNPDAPRTCYIVIAGDRGLAGGYNNNVFKTTLGIADKARDCVLPVGKKAVEYFLHRGFTLLSEAFSSVEDFAAAESAEVARLATDAYRDGTIDRLVVVYTHFVSMMSQVPVKKQLLPLDAPEKSTEDVKREFVLYEPSADTVLSSIVPDYVAGMLYGAVCESYTSELAARRTAMDSASKNADAMIDTLSLKYNRARQGAITQEITEIVAGADA